MAIPTIPANTDDAATTSFVDGLMARLSLAEKLGQLNLLTASLPIGKERADEIRAGRVGGLLGGLFPCSFGVGGPRALREVQEIAVHESRLGIPLLLAYDVIHGHQTVFPIPLALSCAWDMAVVETAARWAAREASAQGLNWVFSPMVDIGRDPRWGRIAEGPGEDPYLGACVARAMVKGLQGDDLRQPDTVMACVKHFVGYGAAEGGRDYNNADMSPARLREVYLPPFQAAVAAGAGSAMLSFLALNGMPSHADAALIEECLGGLLTVSDFDGIPEMIAHGLGDEEGRIDEADPLQTLAERSLRAGVHMDMMGHAYATRLEAALAAGRVTQAHIDAACRAVLRAKVRLGLFDDPFARFDEARAARTVHAPEARAAARAAAAQSCVLLQNKGDLLPLPRQTLNLAVIGPLADDTANILGPWSFQGDPGTAVSVLEGIRQAAGPGVRVAHARGANITDDPRMLELANFAGPRVVNDPRPPETLIAEAVAVASAADVVVAVMGEASEMSGEAASRQDLGLPGGQRRLLEALHDTGTPIVLVVMNGRPLTLSWETDHLPALLVAWFGGCEAGAAIAELLFGDRAPSGRLSTTWPRQVGQIPLSYDHASTGRPGDPKADPGKYSTRCYLDGPSTPLFPFGFGLGYTTFAYDDLAVDKATAVGADTVMVSVRVTNTGSRAGQETVQLYVGDPVASVVRPVRRLRGFQKIPLEPGEARRVSFEVTTRDLEFFHPTRGWGWEAGAFLLGIGPHAEATQTVRVDWRKEA
ncbi:beta-glucosidase BglX [Pararhodospirillum oryzae]|uniref:beta-glucosidase n=1 Tax=Pararhodospirillum oryzae TaxID=478448 RepID=A0A512HBQ3_9PROT|nr:beta-glucosidase BglX [Pararhodospirillum oryzae]GEO82884.1 glycosyl hydrolase [Pararhodospirillum oryzae]